MFKLFVERTSTNTIELVIELTDMEFKKTLSPYYYVLISEKIESQSPREQVESSVFDLLNFWKSKIIASTEGEYILPFEFEDEYVGGFLVQDLGEIIHISYGFVRMGGYAISISNPVKVYNQTQNLK